MRKNKGLVGQIGCYHFFELIEAVANHILVSNTRDSLHPSYLMFRLL